MPSIQHKIQVGYYAFATSVATLALLAYSELTDLERHMAPNLAASRLLDTVLEIRRCEKHWFLDGEDGALAEARAFAQQARNLIADGRAPLVALGGTEALDRLDQDLHAYGQVLGAIRDPSATSEQDQGMVLALRQTGRRLAEGAESLAQAQHLRLGRAVSHSRIGILAAGGLAILLAVLAARWLAGRTTRPLALLVERLAAITAGRYDQVTPVSQDREILVVTTAMNRLLAELEVRRGHLVQAEKLASLGTLISGVAHELNNPLSNISSSCQILGEELALARPRDELAQWLEQIDSETERARIIVRNLLDFSRKRSFRKSPLPLVPLVDQTLRLVSRGTGDHRVRTCIPPDLMVHADPQRLQQVLVNLIRNAIEATPQGSDPVLVSAEALEATHFQLPRHSVCGPSGTFQALTGRLVAIRVEDRGPGIPAAVLPRVFDPFFTTKDVGHGSGLGLYVSQEIVHQHGGCMGVESTPGHGARFVVALPDEPRSKPIG